MNFKFWEWFKKKSSVNSEYQNAVTISRGSMGKVDRFKLDSDSIVREDVVNPDLGVDDPFTLRRKLKYGIHQSTNQGSDTVNLSGVRAMAESATVVGKVDKSRLYDLGYDIREESASFVANMGLASAMPQSVVEEDVTAEKKELKAENVEFLHYTGKTGDRPWDMRVNPSIASEGE